MKKTILFAIFLAFCLFSIPAKDARAVQTAVTFNVTSLTIPARAASIGLPLNQEFMIEGTYDLEIFDSTKTIIKGSRPGMPSPFKKFSVPNTTLPVIFDYVSGQTYYPSIKVNQGICATRMHNFVGCGARETVNTTGFQVCRADRGTSCDDYAMDGCSPTPLGHYANCLSSGGTDTFLRFFFPALPPI